MNPAQILPSLSELMPGMSPWAIALAVLVVGLVKYTPGVIDARDRARLNKILARRLKKCGDDELERLLSLYQSVRQAKQDPPNAESTQPHTDRPPPAPPPQPDELT